MKNYKVRVADDKVEFFKELLDNLGLSAVELSNSKTEQDVSKQPESKTQREEPPPAYKVDDDSRKKAARVREESLIDVIKKIEKMRGR